MSRRRHTATALLAAAVSIASGAVRAHHSFAALFDATKTVTVSGTVVVFEFKAPHSYIELEAVGEDGERVTWEVETTTPGMLIRMGITPEALQAGDTVSVRGNPARDGRPLIRLTHLTTPDGEELQIQ
jgi:hypothetical protein